MSEKMSLKLHKDRTLLWVGKFTKKLHHLGKFTWLLFSAGNCRKKFVISIFNFVLSCHRLCLEFYQFIIETTATVLFVASPVNNEGHGAKSEADQQSSGTA